MGDGGDVQRVMTTTGCSGTRDQQEQDLEIFGTQNGEAKTPRGAFYGSPCVIATAVTTLTSQLTSSLMIGDESYQTHHL